jgi:hypothetical protein
MQLNDAFVEVRTSAGFGLSAWTPSKKPNRARVRQCALTNEE